MRRVSPDESRKKGKKRGLTSPSPGTRSFKACITKPSDTLTPNDQACLMRCSDRFLEVCVAKRCFRPSLFGELRPLTYSRTGFQHHLADVRSTVGAGAGGGVWRELVAAVEATSGVKSESISTSPPSALSSAHPAWSRRMDRCAQAHLAGEGLGEGGLRRQHDYFAERAGEEVQVYQKSRSFAYAVGASLLFKYLMTKSGKTEMATMRATFERKLGDETKERSARQGA